LRPKSTIKIQHSDKDKEICRIQPSSPAAASCCQVTQILPSTFLAATMARAVAVAVAVLVAVVVVVVWQWWWWRWWQ
jgi:hypothetical protein